jgi:hypothetical protein
VGMIEPEPDGRSFGGFTSDINGNCAGTCLASGSFQFAGTAQEARDALQSAGAWNYGFWDALNSTAFGHHPETDQYRFAAGPSLHVSVPWDFLLGEVRPWCQTPPQQSPRREAGTLTRRFDIPTLNKRTSHERTEINVSSNTPRDHRRPYGRVRHEPGVARLASPTPTSGGTAVEEARRPDCPSACFARAVRLGRIRNS